MEGLRARTALLTGASSGLGPVIARRLYREGVRLVLTSRRQPELQRLAAELDGSRVIVADLSRRGETERLASEVGPIDILISSAGVPVSGLLIDLDVSGIDRGLDVNSRSAILLTRLMLPGMLKRRHGHIVLMASIAGQIPGRRNSVYNATKFGLRGFGHALRLELVRIWPPRHPTAVKVKRQVHQGEAGSWTPNRESALPLERPQTAR